MKTTADNQEDYIDAWDRYINVLYTLMINPDHELGESVEKIIDSLKHQMRLVAQAKYTPNKGGEKHGR